jgi:hypothetical protein
VSIAIDDQERLEKLGRQTFVDGADIVAAHRDVSYPEIDAVNMKQAIWWPLLNDDSARLSIDVRCRGHAFGEEIVMRRVGKDVAYSLHVRNASGETLLSCSDLSSAPEQRDGVTSCSNPAPLTSLRRWLGRLRMGSRL